ncbi:MAG: hypothetical protein AAGG51_16240 [Cyanobacteria bacterium P01_G01_bin.54]
MRTFLITAMAVFLALTAACSSDTFRPLTNPKDWGSDLFGLNTEIEGLLSEGEHSFHVEGRTMSIALMNTPSNEASAEEREAFANEVADTIRTYLEEEQLFPNLKTLRISFHRVEQKSFYFTDEVVGDVYKFSL